jgi:type II secretory pathway component GspD/PulD (secretin)
MALNDTIVVLDYPENIAKVENLIKELDVRPKQVLIEATILSATLSEQTAFGIDWSTLNGVTIDTILNVGKGASDGISAYGFASKAVTDKGTIGDGLNIGVTSDHVAALIRALETVTDLTVLANPKILAINKQLGQVYIGKKYGYLSQTTVSEGGASTSQVSFLETGTKLSFRPYIGNDGYIRMDIHPKDSDGSVSGGLPSETSTEVATNIMVKEGQTIVIGGLFRDTVDTSRNQVPLLGDLPFIGTAFRSTVDKSKREEVIVMLTPHIVEESEHTEGQERATDIGRKRSAAKDELQWIDRARLAEDAYAQAVKFYLDGNNESAIKQLTIALNLRPTYLEALRLKEKIIAGAKPEDMKKFERIMLEVIDKQEASKWMRR